MASGSTLSLEHIYHYRLPDEEIPELLVNISSIVDQHQELANEAHEMVIEQVSVVQFPFLTMTG